MTLHSVILFSSFLSPFFLSFLHLLQQQQSRSVVIVAVAAAAIIICCCCCFHFYCPAAIHTYRHTHTHAHPYMRRVDEAGRCLFALSTTNWIGSGHSEAKGNRQACFNVCSLPCVCVCVCCYRRCPCVCMCVCMIN